MATPSSVLAWKVPWMEESGKLQGLQRVGHNCATSLSIGHCFSHVLGNFLDSENVTAVLDISKRSYPKS